MSLRIVGAGLGRTGTNSLKVALEHLLGGPCYHMFEVHERPEHTPIWLAAVRGQQVDVSELLDGYRAAVDWPAAAFWRELHAANPQAPVLLSTRDSAETWWRSMSRTIVTALSQPGESGIPVERRAMIRELMRKRFTPDFESAGAAIAAYQAHNAEVRAGVAPELLVEWQPSDGWEPICAALELAVPEIPFPHENTTAEFRSRLLGPARDQPPGS